MLSAWEHQYRRRNSHLEVKARRALVKLNRWWIFYKYSGNPERNTYILTSRPNNIPLISLRNEEYDCILSNKEYVDQKWNKFWDQRIQPNIEMNSPPKQLQAERRPLREISYLGGKNSSKKEPNFSTNKVYSDLDKENCSRFPRNITHGMGSMRMNGGSKTSIHILNDGSWSDGGSLESFERNLLESVRGTYTRAAMMLPFSQSRQSQRVVKTPVYDTSVPSYSQLSRPYIYNEPELQSKLQMIPLEEGNNRNNALKSVSFENNRLIERTTKFRALGFDGDRIAVQNQIKLSGLRGWVTNNIIRPETRSTFGNRMTLDSNPVGQSNEIPLIQRSDFFTQGRPVSKQFHSIATNQLGTEKLREQQVKQYIRPKKRKRMSKSKKIAIDSRDTTNTRDIALSLLSKLKSNAKQLLKSSVTESVANGEYVSRPGSHLLTWRIFNGSRDSKKLPLGRDFSSSYRALTLQTLMKLESKKGKKTVTIATPNRSPEPIQLEPQKVSTVVLVEGGDPLTDSFTDEFDIFDCYENYSTTD